MFLVYFSVISIDLLTAENNCKLIAISWTSSDISLSCLGFIHVLPMTPNELATVRRRAGTGSLQGANTRSSLLQSLLAWVIGPVVCHCSNSVTRTVGAETNYSRTDTSLRERLMWRRFLGATTRTSYWGMNSHVLRYFTLQSVTLGDQRKKCTGGDLYSNNLQPHHKGLTFVQKLSVTRVMHHHNKGHYI